MTHKRTLKYAEAINEAFHEEMALDERVIQIGVGVNTPWYVGQTLQGLLERFGEERMIDTPVSENGVAGMAIGAAMTGMRPILTFPRMDFMYYAMDQLCNQCAMVNYSLGGNRQIPITVRAIINRGGEQGAQHSQALQSVFMHVPGLKVVMPADPVDAKGMLVAAIRDPNPVVYIDDRWLYDEEAVVPEGDFTRPLTGARLVKQGTDVTVVSSSYLLAETSRALSSLQEAGISVELIDLRTLTPVDIRTIRQSVRKTRQLVIVDGTWKTGGVAAEVSAMIAEEGFEFLSGPIVRFALPDTPAPASAPLEKTYYFTRREIAVRIADAIGGPECVKRLPELGAIE